MKEDFTILVVDDDLYINEMIHLYLKNKGFRTTAAFTGKEALEKWQKEGAHLIILDIMLPDLNGWEVCKEVRKTSQIPILMLTAKGESEDKLKGFEIGADDYLVKPFDPNEMVARVQSLLKRAYLIPPPDNHSLFQFGRLKIDPAGRSVTIENIQVELTPREYKLLLILCQHPNQVLARQQLLDQVWGEDFLGEDRVVDVFVTRLRAKLASGMDGWRIETIRGIGYKFKVEKTL
ncbi:response regulator transcription factor [Neobacillus sp. SM06]|uniref:response regulator transcription factor n=1 Tax=Neobacillus sp. SM06 TaxID=3422492 RepID=UPI003D2C8528